MDMLREISGRYELLKRRKNIQSFLDTECRDEWQREQLQEEVDAINALLLSPITRTTGHRLLLASA